MDACNHAVAPPGNQETKGLKGAQQPPSFSGGDMFGTATLIPALPYVDTGNTCSYLNNYVPCGDDYNVSPDVVYRFVPATDMCVQVSLCGSDFDTQLSVYGTTDSLVACQDDSPECGLQSHIKNLPMKAGVTYYIVIDGYEETCGNYTLTVETCPPPPVCDVCPPGARIENEPVCSDGYVDAVNSGCNSTPHRFLFLPCAHSVTVCGTYGVYDQNITRDTDWYQLAVPAPTTITAVVKGTGLTGTVLGIVDTACPPNILSAQLAPIGQCATVTCSAAVPGGSYRIIVTTLFDFTPCGSTYVLTVSGLDCPTAAREVTWGGLKLLYR